jgi:hypothetical protein
MAGLRWLSNRAELSRDDLRLPFRIKHDAEDGLQRPAYPSSFFAVRSIDLDPVRAIQ